MKEAFDDKNFKPETLKIINYCNGILQEYYDKGYDLTLRQLYYQLVSRDIIPNKQSEYNRLGSIVNDARMTGIMDWDMIVDRGRTTIVPNTWDSPKELLETAASQFRIDKWKDQKNHIEVMVEKQALEGVLEPACDKLQVSFTSNKGYSSQSFMYRKGKELSEKINDGKEVIILYFGDHDPSGLDMDRDIFYRISTFANVEMDLNKVKFINIIRVALTMDQIDYFKPPPNPAKLSDSRSSSYVKKHGDKSWELDALKPEVLAKLVHSFVLNFRDDDLWKEAVDKETEMKNKMIKQVENF